jgi:hypothetical protein
MSKSAINFLVDTIALAAIILLGSTGFLIRFVLPPGSGHFSQLWGMDRHQWGQVHFWIAIVLLSTVVLHFLQHWHWVVGMVKGRPGRASAMRVGLASIGVLAFVGIAAAPFLGKVEETGEPPHKMQSNEHQASQINGSMTLHEIEEQTGVPAAVILKELGLPANLPNNERLERLRRQHDFEMHDIQEIVRKHRQQP